MENTTEEQIPNKEKVRFTDEEQIKSYEEQEENLMKILHNNIRKPHADLLRKLGRPVPYSWGDI